VPIALIMGVYGRYVRRGRIFEMSAIGFVMLMAALVYGRTVSETPALAAYFNLSGPQLALIIIGYGFVASVLPVWLLLAPRDYLSTFMKIGVITLLAIAIIVVRTYKCRRLQSISTAAARSGRAACFPSYSSRLPAVRYPAGTL
jgi:carbon starvation protein